MITIGITTPKRKMKNDLILSIDKSECSVPFFFSRMRKARGKLRKAGEILAIPPNPRLIPEKRNEDLERRYTDNRMKNAGITSKPP
jgi:hypothetical protein